MNLKELQMKVLVNHSLGVTEGNHKNTQSGYLRFKIFMAVTILMMFFWDKSQCGVLLVHLLVHFSPEEEDSTIL
jgi:hypothetical protein